jgi:hypothetical protein
MELRFNAQPEFDICLCEREIDDMKFSPFSILLQRIVFLAILVAVLYSGDVDARQDTGYQTIQGTRVFTIVDHNKKIATFTNDCGSQVLSQRQLQQGAIPTDIIPCPRSSRAKPPSGQRDGGYYGEIAVSTVENDLSWGAANNYRSSKEAADAALAACRKRTSSCKLVGGFANGGCGVLATGRSSRGTTWAIGSDRSEVMNRCRSGYGGNNCRIVYAKCASK